MNYEQASLVGGPGILHIAGADSNGNAITHTMLVSKPSAADLVTLQKWVMSRPLPSAGGISSADLQQLDPADRALVLREFAKSKTGKRQPTESEVVEIVYSPDGVAMQVWLAARRNDPACKLDDLRKLITANNCDQVAADLEAAVTGSPVATSTDEGVDPKKRVGAI